MTTTDLHSVAVALNLLQLCAQDAPQAVEGVFASSIQRLIDEGEGPAAIELRDRHPNVATLLINARVQLDTMVRQLTVAGKETQEYRKRLGDHLEAVHAHNVRVATLCRLLDPLLRVEFDPSEPDGGLTKCLDDLIRNAPEVGLPDGPTEPTEPTSPAPTTDLPIPNDPTARVVELERALREANDRLRVETAVNRSHGTELNELREDAGVRNEFLVKVAVLCSKVLRRSVPVKHNERNGGLDELIDSINEGALFPHETERLRSDLVRCNNDVADLDAEIIAITQTIAPDCRPIGEDPINRLRSIHEQVKMIIEINAQAQARSTDRIEAVNTAVERRRQETRRANTLLELLGHAVEILHHLSRARDAAPDADETTPIPFPSEMINRADVIVLSWILISEKTGQDACLPHAGR